MADSILTTTKKLLGVPADYDVFDLDIITHINSAFSTLQQLGVGPTNGFMITDATAEWETYLADDNRINMVRTYVFQKVKLAFDPPVSGFALTALKEEIQQAEWRLNVAVDTTPLEEVV